jgi:hypothetical protein
MRGYVEKVTGMSASQMTRLIRAFLDQGVIGVQPYQRHSFSTRYTMEDIGLPAEVARAHERLAKICVAHLYNLRATVRYRNRAAVFEPTRRSAIVIGERRRPDPQGRPGVLRVDTGHQGDWDGAKSSATDTSPASTPKR